ncbi:MAG: class I SAM-dependent methyltransferase [Polyangiaceae bacterium]
MRALIDERLTEYAEAHSHDPGPLFAELARVTRETRPDAQMQVGRVEGALLRMLVSLTGARRILEIGTFTGYSALSMAEALPPDGKLVTCDVDPVATAVARSFFDRSPAGPRIEIRLGDGLETLRTFPEGDTFDLVFIDADKARYADYYEAALPRLRSGGLLVADNTLWSGRVLDPESADDHGIVRFNKVVASDPRVVTVLLSVRDGVMLVRKL